MNHGEETIGRVKTGLVMPKPKLKIYFLEGGLALKMGRVKEVTIIPVNAFCIIWLHFSIYLYSQV